MQHVEGYAALKTHFLLSHIMILLQNQEQLPVCKHITPQ